MTIETTKKASGFSSVPETDRSRLIAARRHGQSANRDTATRDRANDLGGIRLQLALHGELPGYKLCWINDENGAVETKLHEGWDFVTQDELYQGKAAVVPDLDITSCLSKFVKGMRADGQPLRAYVMKCPDDQWKAIEAHKHGAADERDRQIHKKASDPNRADGFYKPDSVNTTIDTGYRKEYLAK